VSEKFTATPPSETNGEDRNIVASLNERTASEMLKRADEIATEGKNVAPTLGNQNPADVLRRLDDMVYDDGKEHSYNPINVKENLSKQEAEEMLERVDSIVYGEKEKEYTEEDAKSKIAQMVKDGEMIADIIPVMRVISKEKFSEEEIKEWILQARNKSLTESQPKTPETPKTTPTNEETSTEMSEDEIRYGIANRVSRGTKDPTILKTVWQVSPNLPEETVRGWIDLERKRRATH
jgi:hypothetical protein